MFPELYFSIAGVLWLLGLICVVTYDRIRNGINDNVFYIMITYVGLVSAVLWPLIISVGLAWVIIWFVSGALTKRFRKK
jgi:hypothetical protein